jgi:hypothetical protein
LRFPLKIKNLMLISILLTTLQTVQAKTLIISDIDDTIKMTDVLGSKTTVIFNSLFNAQAFSGMSELYQEMTKNDDTIIYYITGSPKIIKFKVDDFLEGNHFPQTQNLILKDEINDNTYEYKTEVIRELIQKIRPDKMILLGDDTQFDPEVYKTISDENPKIEFAVYIHSIQNKIVNQPTFFSAIEVAGNEMLEGRLTEESLGIVAQGFLAHENNSVIGIKGRYCPLEGRVFINELEQRVSDQNIIQLLQQSQDEIMSSCH